MKLIFDDFVTNGDISKCVHDVCDYENKYIGISKLKIYFDDCPEICDILNIMFDTEWSCVSLHTLFYSAIMNYGKCRIKYNVMRIKFKKPFICENCVGNKLSFHAYLCHIESQSYHPKKIVLTPLWFDKYQCDTHISIDTYELTQNTVYDSCHLIGFLIPHNETVDTFQYRYVGKNTVGSVIIKNIGIYSVCFVSIFDKTITTFNDLRQSIKNLNQNIYTDIICVPRCDLKLTYISFTVHDSFDTP